MAKITYTRGDGKGGTVTKTGFSGSSSKDNVQAKPTPKSTGAGNPDGLSESEVNELKSNSGINQELLNNYKRGGRNNDVNSIINANQDGDIENAPSEDSAPTRGETRTSRYSTAFSEISDMMGSGDRPEAPNFTDLYNDARGELNVDDLEGYVNDLQTEEENIYADLRQRRTAERGKTVATNVIGGRIGEAERQEAERIDYIGRQKNVAIRQLQSANATIENMINFQKLDYDTARNSYNDQFSQQMSMFNIVKGVVDAEISDEERMADNSRANLNIIYGSIADGTVDKSTMTPEMRYQVSKMELSAGLPTGFYDNLQNQNPDGKILSTTTRSSNGGKYADVITQNPGGGFSTQSIYLGAADTSGSGNPTLDTDGDGLNDAEFTFEEYVAAAQEELQMSVNPDSDIYTQLKQQYDKDFGATQTISKFSSTEIKKLEQAGLQNAPRQEQLDFLYKKDEEKPDPVTDPEGYAKWAEANL